MATTLEEIPASVQMTPGRGVIHEVSSQSADQLNDRELINKQKEVIPGCARRKFCVTENLCRRDRHAATVASPTLLTAVSVLVVTIARKSLMSFLTSAFWQAFTPACISAFMFTTPFVVMRLHHRSPF